MCHKTLPQGYSFFDKIDLKNNKKQFWTVQGICLATIAVMLGIGWLIESPLKIENNTESIIGLVVLIVGFVLYIFAHEAVHGLFMYAFCKTKIKYGFVGWAAYAGSSAYYDKKHYIIIALAPVVVWGVVFAVLNIFFHSGIWFWVIWFLQICNISGAAGDFFCVYKTARYPKDILVNDTGLEMQIFCRNAELESNNDSNKESIPEIVEETAEDKQTENNID